jgi:hypothetical protein
MPVADVPPRTSNVSPAFRPNAVISDPYAVCSVSGTAPSTSHGSSDRNGITQDRGTIVYSAYRPSNTRPIPPIIATTCCPARSSDPGAASTTPTHSIPGTRGNVTPSASPNRVCSSDRFSPNARTRIRTHPNSASGTGNVTNSRFCTGPGPLNTTARIVAVTPGTLVA